MMHKNFFQSYIVFQEDGFQFFKWNANFFTLYESKYGDKFNNVLFNDLHTYIRSEMKGIFRILRIDILTDVSYWDDYSSYSIWIFHIHF